MSDDPVAKAARAYRRAETILDLRRAELAEAIGRAILIDNRKQADVARITGYTREHIRRICRDWVNRMTADGMPF